MIARKMLIITYPGEVGEENYCKGVFKDAENYPSYFKSANGGAWETGEIKVLPSGSSKSDVERELQKLKSADYSVVIFAGHGRYNSNVRQTEIRINKNETMYESELHTGTKRQLLILDCCREKSDLIIQKSLRENFSMDSYRLREAEYYRTAFDKQLLASDLGLITVYGCDIGECCKDIENEGGLFSYTLLKQCNGNYDLSISDVFEKANPIVYRNSRNEQDPQIKTAKGKSFPFYIA